MTKLIVPQIGDIVRGQVVTEAAHKLWVDMASKLDALEGVANDDLTDELTTLTETVEARSRFIPKITTQITDQFNPIEDGYGFYLVTASFPIALDPSQVTTAAIRIVDDTTVLMSTSLTSYSADVSEPVVNVGCHVALTQEMIPNGKWLNLFIGQGTTTVPAFTEVTWTAIKYKTE